MDTMGDADELYDHDDVPPPRQPLVTTEALAVTSLTAAVTSLLVTSVSQYLIFLQTLLGWATTVIATSSRSTSHRSRSCRS